MTGIVKVRQNEPVEQWEEVYGHTATGPQIILSPDLTNLVVAQLRSVQALDENGATDNDLSGTREMSQ